MLAHRLSGAVWRPNIRSTQSYCTATEATSNGPTAAARPLKTHAKRIKRANVRNIKLGKQKILTPRMSDYFKLKHAPTKFKQSKTMAMLSKFVSIHPVKYDVDESKLSNAEFIKQGLAEEVNTSSLVWKVMPNFVPRFTPSINLKVIHGDATTVYRGNYLPSVSARPKPNISYEAKEGSLYTVMMVDPDIPLKDSDSDAWFHYTVVNVPGSNIDQGHVLAEWIPPAPPKDTGVHRYIWLVLEQPQGLEITDQPTLSATDFKRTFDFHDFIRRHHLKPRGLCFHRTQFDNDVSELYESWGSSASGFNKKDYRSKIVIKQRQYQDM